MKAIPLFILLISMSISSYGQSYDARDDWAGTLKGTTSCSTNKSSYLRATDRLELYIYKKNNSDRLGTCGSGSSSYSIYINLPNDYSQIRNLQISKNEIKCSPTRKYPVEYHLYKERDKYGDIVIKGYFKYYEVLGNGELSLRQHFYDIFAY